MEHSLLKPISSIAVFSLGNRTQRYYPPEVRRGEYWEYSCCNTFHLFRRGGWGVEAGNINFESRQIIDCSGQNIMFLISFLLLSYCTVLLGGKYI